MDKCDAPVTAFDRVFHEILHAGFVVRKHCRHAPENVIDRDTGNPAPDQVFDFLGFKIGTDQAHAVQMAAPAAVGEAETFPDHFVVDKSDIITVSLRFLLESVQNEDKERMGEPPAAFLRINDAQVVRLSRISGFIGRFHNLLDRLHRNVADTGI